MRWMTAVAVLLVLGGCSRSEKSGGTKKSSAEDDAPSSTQSDADLLGREIYDLVDRAMSYKSAHRARLPRSLTELGVDALTRTTARTLTVKGDIPEVTVAFRDPGTRTLSSCRGTNAILEEASLSGGQFSVICTLTSGGSTTLQTSK